MGTWNFVKGRRVTDLFRLCLGIIVLVTMVMGGITLNTQPVQAALTISQPSPCPINLHVKPCVNHGLQFKWSGTGFSPPPLMNWWATNWYWYQTPLSPALADPNSYVYLNQNSGLLSYRFCKLDAGKTFTFKVWVREYRASC